MCVQKYPNQEENTEQANDIDKDERRMRKRNDEQIYKQMWCVSIQVWDAKPSEKECYEC